MTRKPDSASLERLEAALFDMDGVVTDTAEAHAAAWKRLFDAYLKTRAERTGETFRPFDANDDYREYVDGKPRYDGVESFLASRGIELPKGGPDDDPNRETICGLGNRKNRYFRDWLEENTVSTFPSTFALIRQLREAGVRVGVFSSSRNAGAVLRNASAREFFDVKVDGNELAKQEMPGKPDAAMLLEAASRLDAAPGRTAVFEDAIAGVEAGAAGDFGLVVGIDRAGEGDALAAHGAHLVVADLSELDFDPDAGLRLKVLAELPEAREEELRNRVAGKQCAIFLDYDGTLTPIVEDHTKAFLGEDMREALERLARRCVVAVISGRGLADLKERVGLESVYYAGSHGFEIERPGRMKETLEKGEEFLPELDAAERELRDRLAGIEGHSVERKLFSIAVHYRQVAEKDIPQVKETFDDVAEQHPDLREFGGKKVLQLQPRVDWNKGRAVRWMLERLELDRKEVLPVYIGDDLTDEDAFRALAGTGLGIAVGDEWRRTAADYRLAELDDVRRFLETLASISEG